jgi:hypothetical protein
MWLAGFDLLLGARSRSFAAALLLGCAGCGDQEAAPDDTHDEAGFETDAVAERASDTPLDDHRAADTAIVHPPDRAEPDVSSGDEKSADVAAEMQPKLALCLRLMDPQDPNHVFKLSQTVGDAYLLLVNGDCRIKGAAHPPGGATVFADWRNALYEYNPALWGCIAPAPEGFALLSTAFQDFSRADVALLIELYLRAATTVLALTTSEVADLRSDLQRLAASLPVNESTEYTFSSCAGDASVESDAPTDAGAEIDVSQAEATTDAAHEAAEATTEPTDAKEETLDASAEDEGGDD